MEEDEEHLELGTLLKRKVRNLVRVHRMTCLRLSLSQIIDQDGGCLRL